MKSYKFVIIASLIVLNSCSSLEEISTNTAKTNEILESTKPQENFKDLLLPRINYNELYSNIIIWDTSYFINNDWYGYTVKFKNNPNSNVAHVYDGFFNSANPDLLYIQNSKLDTSSQFIDNYASINNSFTNFNKRALKVNENEWNKILLNGDAVFSGLIISRRNMNFIDLKNYNLSYSTLLLDTLYKIRGVSSSRIELESNTTTELLLKECVLSNIELTNWHFIAKDLVTKTYWYKNQLINSDLNDVTFRNFEIREGIWNNVIVRHSNFGSFEKIRFADIELKNMLLENAYFKKCEFYDTKISGKINNCDFIDTKFGTGSATNRTEFVKIARISGRFNQCQFNKGTVFNQSNLLDCNIWQGSMRDVQFNNNCRLKNVTFINIPLIQVDFNNSHFENITFGNSSSQYPMSVLSCDYSNVTWGPNVEFNRCNLSGCKFPSRSFLNSKGVKFINCENEPQ